MTFEYIKKDSNKRQRLYLVIGNGFDIECGFKTKYSDFIKFCSIVLRIINEQPFYIEYQQVIDEVFYEGNNDDCFLAKKYPEFKKLLEDREYFEHNKEQWNHLVNDNYWINYFLNKEGTWIDFEAAIAKVIKDIELSRDLYPFYRAELDDCIMISESSTLIDVVDGILNNFSSESRINGNQLFRKYNNYTFGDLKKKLLDDLNRLIKAFDKYLFEIVDSQEIEFKKLSKTIDCLMHTILKADEIFVLNFNYTHSIEKIMNYYFKDVDKRPKVHYCHIHGETENMPNEKHLVLGIDEYLKDSFVDTDVAFIDFKKYFQKILKETSTIYASWMEQCEFEHIDTEDGRLNYVNNLITFGHSLGTTDKEILEPFMKPLSMRVTCFYYGEEMHSGQIKNLVTVIHKDNLIKKTSSVIRTLQFVNQDELMNLTKVDS